MLDLQCESPGVLLGFPPLYYKMRFQKASKKTPHNILIFKVNKRAVSSNKRLGFKANLAKAVDGKSQVLLAAFGLCSCG